MPRIAAARVLVLAGRRQTSKTIWQVSRIKASSILRREADLPPPSGSKEVPPGDLCSDS